MCFDWSIDWLINRTTDGLPVSFEADRAVVMDGFRHLVGLTEVGVRESFALEADWTVVVNDVWAGRRRRRRNTRTDHLTFLHVRRWKTPHQTNIVIFGTVQYLFTKFSEIIHDTICRYYCKCYHINFRCSEVAQFLRQNTIFFNCADK